MSKLLVFCLDALCTSDLEYMKTLPNLGWVINNGSYVKHAEPVYPSLTYPCHVSILTGNYVDKHGVSHNEIVVAGKFNEPWYNQRADVKTDTLLDVAKKHGLSTCSLSWPVTGKADFDLNMPMIVPIWYTGYEPIQFLEGNATQELLDRYYEKHGHFLMGEERNLDKYTMALALDILKDYPQPDVMLIKMCDLDSAHHMYGVHHPKVNEQLDLHDEQFGQILEMVRSNGDFENTNLVILGDHGQSDITQGINFNILLKQNGFITVDAEDNLVDYDAYCHSASLSAWIELKDSTNRDVYGRVYNFLNELVKEKKYGLGHLLTKQEAKDQFNLSGPFDFIVEGEKAVAFNTTLKGENIIDKAEYKDYDTLRASHGSLPWKEQTTAFIAYGPNVKPGVVINRRSIVDEAPTMAAMLGFEMEGIDGTVITEILN